MSHVVVIGAGIVGAATAYELLRAGHRVSIVEPATPGGGQAASYGNGAWISPASIIPMSVPGLWRKVPGYILNRNGPLTIRWRDVPDMIPWLTRFLLAGATRRRVERTATILASLLKDSPQRHTDLAGGVGCPDLIAQTGLLYAYPHKSDFDNESFSWELRRRNGIRWSEYLGSDLHRLEPALSDRYQFGAYVEEGAHCVDPGAYVGAIVETCRQMGATLISGTVHGFDIENARLRAVMTDHGPIECDHAVISAGIWSKVLAERAGDKIPLQSERGYHAVIINPKTAPNIPVMPSDGKMANTLTLAGLRLSGQVELASTEAEPDWNRVEILLRHALSTYPELGERGELMTRFWMGHRPSTSDGLPVIGRASGSPGILYAFGHGHVGLASGPVTGRIVADMVSGQLVNHDMDAFSPRRF